MFIFHITKSRRLTIEIIGRRPRGASSDRGYSEDRIMKKDGHKTNLRPEVPSGPNCPEGLIALKALYLKDEIKEKKRLKKKGRQSGRESARGG